MFSNVKHPGAPRNPTLSTPVERPRVDQARPSQSISPSQATTPARTARAAALTGRALGERGSPVPARLPGAVSAPRDSLTTVASGSREKSVAGGMPSAPLDHARAELRQIARQRDTILRNAAKEATVARGAASTLGKPSQIEQVFISAGLRSDHARALAREGVTPARAQALLVELVGQPPTLASHAPTRVAAELLSGIAAGVASVSAHELGERLTAFERFVLVRPDGYIADALTGQAIQRADPVRVENGRLKTGPLDVGELYHFELGQLYRLDEEGRRTHEIVYELSPDDVFNAALDGVEAALADAARGVLELLREPERAMKGIAALPAALVTLLRNSPEQLARLGAMPAEDQVRTLAELVSQASLTYGTLRVVGAGVDALASSTALVPRLTLSPQGALAISVDSAGVASVVAPAAGGPGAIVVLQMSRRRESTTELPPQRAPADAVVNAVDRFERRRYRFGSNVYAFDRAGLKHVLERHHPRFWDGSIKPQQSFFGADVSVETLVERLEEVLTANQERLAKSGLDRKFQLEVLNRGEVVVVGITDGRIGQFYPRVARSK